MSWMRYSAVVTCMSIVQVRCTSRRRPVGGGRGSQGSMWLLVCCLHGRRSRRRRSGPPLASLVRNSRCMMSFITRIRIFSERCLTGATPARVRCSCPTDTTLPAGSRNRARSGRRPGGYPGVGFTGIYVSIRTPRVTRLSTARSMSSIMTATSGGHVEPQWIAVIGPAGVQAERLTVEEFRAPISSTEKLATTPTSRAWLPPTRTVPIDKERDAVSVSARSENQRAR